MRQILGTAIVAIVYLCMIIIVFAPTIYMGWVYWISRKFAGKTRDAFRLVLVTFLVNAMIAYLLVHFAFNYFLKAKMAEWDALARVTVENAVASQRNYFKIHGSYYPVGPIRGPYRDEHGLTVAKDVILEVVPRWDKQQGGESVEIYAVHVFANELFLSSKDGKIERARDSPEMVKLKQRLFNSVR